MVARGEAKPNGGFAMSAVMIRCPSTGAAVSTAIETEPGDFRRLPILKAKMRCPSCGQDHVWQTSSAWLQGEPRLVEMPAAVTTAAA
jgi:hypothetical protein